MLNKQIAMQLRAALAAAMALAAGPIQCAGADANATAHMHDRFLALPIAKGDAACARMLYKYGIPFVETAWHAPENGTLQVNVGATAKRIYLLGLTETQRPSAWSSPLSYAMRYIVGDKLGAIRVHYVDGSTQEYPLILGESVWWGEPFFQAQGPYPSDARFRAALSESMRLYPAAPVDDGNYVAVIAPKDAQIASIEIAGTPEKKGSVAIAGITVEAAPGTAIAGATPIPANDLSPDFAKFVAERSLRQSGADESGDAIQLKNLSDALYSTDADLKRPIPVEIPRDYRGPQVTFKGNNTAAVLQNAFYANVQDMVDKVDADGMYNTSTRGALSWAGDPRSAGGEFGTYRKDVGVYYGQSWSRDMGRTMQEMAELGYLSQVTHNADYSFRTARLWEEKPQYKVHGEYLPPHWGRMANGPDANIPFENDGQGLIGLAIYKLWQRLPDRDAWLREHWTDVKAAGDWIPWEFDHPEISGAKDGVLYTTGESAGGKGYSVYPDAVCMTMLEAFARMAKSIGEKDSAERWRERAAKMRQAIPAQYLIDDAKYGRIWTLEHAGWPNQSTVLGPLIFLADFNGFAPEDDDPVWRPVNQAAYQRLVDKYKPFGFYGWAMGYGQGFVTQAALLLDRMKDLTPMLDWAAREIDEPEIHSFIVPEGAQVDPTGKYVFRSGDLGNGVQEAEIVKTLRILIGVDDTNPERLRVMPRLPYDWSEMAVTKYPALVEHEGKIDTASLHYDLRRAAGRMNFEISADRQLGPVAMRLGPFEKQPQAADVTVNGKHPADAKAEQSGDSWWMSFTIPVGPTGVAGPVGPTVLAR